MAATFREVTTLRTIRQQALTDELTGAGNRRSLLEQLGDSASTQQPLTVLAMDLDRFKEVNDRHGHAAGDELLALAAARIKGHLRDGDLLARVGGDEFTVLLQSQGVDDAIGIAQRLREALRMPFALKPGTAAIDISIGIASIARARGPHAGAPRAGRQGDVRRQARRHRRRGVPALDGPSDGGQPTPAAAAAADRVRRSAAPAVPAQDRSPHRHRGGRRGPAAMGPSPARPAPAERVPPALRGHGPDAAGDELDHRPPPSRRSRHGSSPGSRSRLAQTSVRPTSTTSRSPS